MKSVKWDKERYKKSFKPPGGWAFFAFQRGARALWSGYSADLGQRLELIVHKAREHKLYAEMIDEADTLLVEEHSQGIQALIHHKVYAQRQAPEYQMRLHPWEDYVYLGLDAHRFPFISIQENTNDDWIYVGPWRSRFFLTDLMDTVARLLKIPFCETVSHPCERLDSGLCQGYCLSLDEPDKAGDLDKLDKLLQEAYLHPKNKLLEMLQKERDNYFNELEFEKADLLNDEVERLQKYRDWLNFLYVAKSLNQETQSFTVRNGLLESSLFEGETHYFPVEAQNYRENEKLALNLHQVDEARIIYEYFIKHKQGPNHA